MLYLDNQCRGILLLTPHDEALIQSLPTFDTMKLKPTRGKRPARKGSLASKLNSCIFLWSADNIAAVQKKIISKVLQVAVYSCKVSRFMSCCALLRQGLLP